ncbi:MAG: lytic transglycosylase domain-containing protein [Zoogloea sp.]|nr:lytic transglycosylase domain-containing protein [Zoogloea sp.]
MWFARFEYAMVALLAILLLAACQSLPTDTKPDQPDNKRKPQPRPAPRPAPPPPAVQEKALINDISRNYSLPPPEATRVVRAASDAAQRTGLQRTLILAVIAVESSFNPMAISNVGARGLMQVLPMAHPNKVFRIGGVDNLHDVEAGIQVGAMILLEYKQMTRDIRVALRRYSGSARNYADKVLARKRHFDMVENGGPVRMGDADEEDSLLSSSDLYDAWPERQLGTGAASGLM